MTTHALARPASTAASAVLLSALLASVSGRCADTPSAQPDAASPNLSDLSLSELFEVRYDNVYGASKRNQHTWEAPASVTVVTRRDIQTFGYSTLADALDSVPGTYVTSDRSYSFLGVRGFSPPGDYNGRVLLLIDGHRANDNIYDSALIGTEGTLDVDLVERLEVIRGPSSSLYGSSAFFGILNVIPRRGGDIQGVEVSGEAGSFETYKTRATAGYKLESGLEFLVSATYFESRGEPDVLLTERIQPGISDGIARDLDDFHGYNLFATVSYLELTLTASASSRDKTLLDPGYESLFGDPRGAIRDASHYFDLKLDHLFENDARLVARAGYHHTDYLGWYPYTFTDPTGVSETIVNRDDARGSWWNSEVLFEKTLFDQLTLTGGAEIRYNFRQDQANFDQGYPDAIYGDVRNTSAVAALFGQADWSLRDNLILSAGVRYDDSSTAEGRLSPRIGLISKPWEPTTLKLLYGSAFRAPNAYEYGLMATYFEGNPNLDPEVVQSFELSAEQKLTESLTASGSLFYNRVEDLIALDDSGPLLTFRNEESTHAFGAEVGVDYRWGKGGLARASYSVQHAERIDTGERLFNAPEHLGRLQLRVPLWKDKVYLSPEIHFVDSIHGTKGRIDSYWTSQVTLFSREIVPGLEASASIYNLLDQDIAHPMSDEYLENAMPQPGRTFRFKLTYRF